MALGLQHTLPQQIGLLQGDQCGGLIEAAHGGRWVTLLCGGMGESAWKIVPMVGFAWAPDNLVLALFDAVLEPIKVHVDGFGTALFDGAI